MSKICPINWTSNDGPQPCAFHNKSGKCFYNPCGFNLDYYQRNCIPTHMDRYKHDSKEVTVPCNKCGKPCKTTTGEIESMKKLGSVEYLCYDCADEKFGWSLAAHIRGD